MAKPQNTSWRHWWWVVLLEWLWKLLRELLKPQPPPLPPPSPPRPPPDNNGRIDMSLEFIQNNAEAYYTASSGTAGDQTFTDQLGNHAALQRGSTTSTDSNDPRYYKRAVDHITFPGVVAGNYMLVPDEAALDITDDLDIRVRLFNTSWGSGTQNIFTKAGSAYAWQLVSGTLRLFINGSQNNSTASVTNFGTNLAWLRVTRDRSSGDINFYEQTDSDSEPGSWTQIGTTVAGTTDAINTNSTSLFIGSSTAGTVLLAGGLVQLIIRDDLVEGTPVLNVQASDNTSGSQTSFTATTGQTVTMNRSSTGNKLIYVPADVGVWQYDGTDDYLQFPATLAPPTGDYTVMVVQRRFGSSMGSTARTYSSESGADNGLSIIPQTNGTSRVRYGGSTTSATSTAASAATHGEVVARAAIYDDAADTIEAWDNETGRAASASTTGVGTVTHTTPRIGIRAYTAGLPDTADVFAVVIFESALSDANLTLVANYLIAKAEATLFQPATIAATATLPAPTVSETIIAQPAAVAATATLPAPTIVMPSASPVTLTIRDTGHTATAKEQT